jgi:hypothetical protein
VSVPINKKRERRFFRLIVSGLYWEMKKTRLPECSFGYNRIDRIEHAKLLVYFMSHNGMQPVAIGKGVFDWTVMFGLEDPTITYWLFRIYEGIYYLASTGSNKLDHYFQAQQCP